MGLAISALASYLGFSLAIGALKAGLAFSRDHLAVRANTRIKTLHGFFVPFFFIHIGLEIDPGALAPSIGLTIPLILIGVAGKLIGVGLPIWIRSGPKDALLLGISMIPRAEIAMLIFIQASLLDSTLVPAELYSAMVIVVIITSVFCPLVLRKLNDS